MCLSNEGKGFWQILLAIGHRVAQGIQGIGIVRRFFQNLPQGRFHHIKATRFLGCHRIGIQNGRVSWWRPECRNNIKIRAHCCSLICGTTQQWLELFQGALLALGILFL